MIVCVRAPVASEFPFAGIEVCVKITPAVFTGDFLSVSQTHMRCVSIQQSEVSESSKEKKKDSNFVGVFLLFG